jgi:hypothetical protein
MKQKRNNVVATNNGNQPVMGSLMMPPLRPIIEMEAMILMKSNYSYSSNSYSKGLTPEGEIYMQLMDDEITYNNRFSPKSS